ncbi:MAG: hypothetical protein K6E51_13810 [Treponema sp.]|nr:hypothetical protein [Treponema sp.]
MKIVTKLLNIGIFLMGSTIYAHYADVHPVCNTEQKRPDAANVNIAGTALLIDGLYVQSGNTFSFIQNGSDTHRYLQPDTLLVYTHDTWSLFTSLSGSGYSYDYDKEGLQGSLRDITFTSEALRGRLGGAMQLSKKMSVGLALDAMQARRTVNTEKEKIEDTACGVGGTLGVQIQMGIIGHLSLQVSTPIKLSYDGNRGDIPPVIKAGMGVWILEELCIKGGCNWYLNHSVQQDQVLTGKNCDYWTGFSVGGGLDWRIAIPVTVQLGCCFIHGGHTSTAQDPVNPVQNGISGIACLEYHIKDNVTIATVLTGTHYFPVSYQDIDISRNEENVRIAITYKPL